MLYFFLLIYYLSSAACSGLLSRHRRAWIIDSFAIEEGHPGPFPYVLSRMSLQRDYPVQFELYGAGADEEPKGVFSIHKQSGALSVHKALDYEEITMLMLRFEAKRADSSIDTKLGIEISIRDINDNPPRFKRDLYEISVDEGSTQGSGLLTLAAFDRDQSGTPNSTFHYEIKSVTPSVPDTEFTIDKSGTISFKGCLDHEAAEKFTIVVEAKDHGEVVSLSSSTTVIILVKDGNNHPPVFNGTTGTSKVREDETGSSPLRLHATDEDTPHSDAWRVKYTIHGDKADHFKIETDPDTNDGILTVVKPLDFEEAAQRELSVSLENQMAYFSCKVTERTSAGLWKVDISEGNDTDEGRPRSVKVIIEVEDCNDPPSFTTTVKEAMLEENSPVGTWVERVTAIDPDSSHARDFIYKVGEDPAGWVVVDPQTGDITTAKTPDRESPHVINGVYTILLHAVDDGEPPMTGTATLNIHVVDQNDNVPQLTVDFVDVCVSDRRTTTNITAFDLDGNPFGGPFIFQLLGDVKGKWNLDPSYGYTAGLVKEPGVYAGPHTINVKISDMQGQFGISNLSVTVCDCSLTPNCRNHKDAEIQAASGAIGIIFASLFLLLFLLLLAVKLSCKEKFTHLQSGDSSGETLLSSNIEQPGTDCKFPDGLLPISPDKTDLDPSHCQSAHDGMQHTYVSVQNLERNIIYNFYEHCSHEKLFSANWDQEWTGVNIRNKRTSGRVSDAAVEALLHRRLSSIKETEDLLWDHQPQIYADEGNSDKLSELENISNPDDDAFLNTLRDLGPKFKKLASICQPPDIEG